MTDYFGIPEAWLSEPVAVEDVCWAIWVDQAKVAIKAGIDMFTFSDGDEYALCVYLSVW